jgi:hypothetical protein
MVSNRYAPAVCVSPRVHTVAHWRVVNQRIIAIRVVDIGGVRRAQADVGRVVLLFVDELETARDGVIDSAGAHIPRDVGLVGEQRVFLEFRLARTRHGPGAGIRRGERQRIHATQHIELVQLAVARGVAQRDGFAEVVFDAGREHRALDLFEVAGEAVVFAVDGIGHHTRVRPGVAGGSGFDRRPRCEAALETERR